MRLNVKEINITIKFINECVNWKTHITLFRLFILEMSFASAKSEKTPGKKICTLLRNNVTAECSCCRVCLIK